MQSTHDTNNRSFVSALSRNLFHTEQEESHPAECRKTDPARYELDEETPYSLRYNVYNVRQEAVIPRRGHDFRLIEELD